MSITARHKKPGAFRKLVNSLETTPPDRRIKIIQALGVEDKELASHAEKSLFHFEDFMGTTDGAMSEICQALKAETRVMAMALHGMGDNIIGKFTNNMTPQIKVDFNEHFEALKQVLPREQLAAQFRIVTKARELEDHGTIQLKRYSGTYPGNL